MSITMFCKATLLTVALAVCVSANPVVSGHGVKIPIMKRRTLTKEDGTFDFDRAIQESVMTQK